MKRNVEGRHLGLSKFSFCMANDKLTVGKWSSISFNIIRGNRLNECGFLRKSWCIHKGQNFGVNLYIIFIFIFVARHCIILCNRLASVCCVTGLVVMS